MHGGHWAVKQGGRDRLGGGAFGVNGDQLEPPVLPVEFEGAGAEGPGDEDGGTGLDGVVILGVTRVELTAEDAGDDAVLGGLGAQKSEVLDFIQGGGDIG